MLIEAAGLAILAAISLTALWPRPTARRVSSLNGWLRHNGRMILACTLAAAGLTAATDGLAGPIRKG